MTEKKSIKKYLITYIDKPYYLIEENVVKCDGDGEVNEITKKQKKVPLQIKEIKELVELLSSLDDNKKVIRVK